MDCMFCLQLATTVPFPIQQFDSALVVLHDKNFENSAFTWALNLYTGDGMLYAFIGYPFNILVDIIVSLCPVPSCPVCCALMFSPRDSPLVCLNGANDLAVSVDKSY